MPRTERADEIERFLRKIQDRISFIAGKLAASRANFMTTVGGERVVLTPEEQARIEASIVASIDSAAANIVTLAQGIPPAAEILVPDPAPIVDPEGAGR